MQFNSLLFVSAFIVFYTIYFLAAPKSANWRKWLIAVFNTIFYYSISGPGLFVLIGASVIDWFIAKTMANKKDSTKRLLLIGSLALSIGLILTFRHITDWFHLDEIAYWPMVVGVSFFAFRSIGYVFDVYNEMTEPVSNWLDYFVFIGFFPLILAGPIAAARDFLPQIEQPLQTEKIDTGKSYFLLSSGIIKKFILSQYLSVNFVDRVFENPHIFTGFENLIASIAQAWVVYLDFSGYTDMMLGMSLLLGIVLPDNFNFPYISGNITEYWRRWHMSLSKWLNEYLFFPMSFAFRKYGKTGTVLAVFITFLISGFWHGTGLQYIIWGGLHAIALAWDIINGNGRSKIKSKMQPAIYNGISVFLTFIFLSLSGIFFKAADTESAWIFLSRIFTHTDAHLFLNWLQTYPWIFAILLSITIWQFLAVNEYEKLQSRFQKLSPFALAIILTAIIFLAYQITGMESIPFIYLKY